MSHIALLLPDLEVGGAQRVMLLLAREFVLRGHTIDLILLRSSGPLLNNIPEGVKVVDLAVRSFGFGQMGFIIFSIFRLSKWMNQKSPDVLLSTITGGNLVTLLAQKLTVASTRIVIREAVSLENVSSSVRLLAMRWLYPQADAVVALSTFMATEITKELGVSLTNIFCINNPVDAAFIIEQGKMPIKHKWLVDDKYKVIISVGRLILQKDYVTLLRAFSSLPTELSARLIIVGEGPERVKLEQLSVDLRITDKMQLVGFDTNPWRWMARANLFVLSSRWEGQPNVLLEALALNLPAVVSEFDVSVHELAQDYGIVVVPPGSQDRLARAIEDQLTVNVKQGKYSFPTDGVGHVASDYLDVLNCND